MNTKKWVEALRSGKFTQCRDSIKDATGYCCLGVAEEIFGGSFIQKPDGTCLNSENGDFLTTRVAKLIFGDESCISPTVLIPDHLRDKVFRTRRESLAELNDSYAFTFEEIADCIEYTWPEIERNL